MPKDIETNYISIKLLLMNPLLTWSLLQGVHPRRNLRNKEMKPDRHTGLIRAAQGGPSRDRKAGEKMTFQNKAT